MVTINTHVKITNLFLEDINEEELVLELNQKNNLMNSFDLFFNEIKKLDIISFGFSENMENIIFSKSRLEYPIDDFTDMKKLLKGGKANYKKFLKEGKYVKFIINDRYFYFYSYTNDEIKSFKSLENFIGSNRYDLNSAIAIQGKHLDILVDNYHFGVRETVANQGYGLNKLSNDDAPEVLSAVRRYCRAHPEIKDSEEILKKAIAKYESL